VALVLFNADTLAAGGSLPDAYDQPSLLSDGFGFNVGVTSNGLRLAHYDNGAATWRETAANAVPLTASTWSLARVRYDGTNVQVGLNGGAWSSPVAAGARGVIANPLTVGLSTIVTARYFDGRIAAIYTAASLTDADIANVRSYLNARYALSV
jgi:hypothetical protein